MNKDEVGDGFPVPRAAKRRPYILNRRQRRHHNFAFIIDHSALNIHAPTFYSSATPTPQLSIVNCQLFIKMGSLSAGPRPRPTRTIVPLVGDGFPVPRAAKRRPYISIRRQRRHHNLSFIIDHSAFKSHSALRLGKTWFWVIFPESIAFFRKKTYS